VNPKDLVRDGYDTVSETYRADDAGDGQEGPWLEELASLLPQAAAVLDLGCGNGVPAARWLTARGYRVTGVDISPVQIERARRLVPDATFLCADFTALDLPAGAFDAVVSFYAIIHVPLEEQPALFRAIRRWLKGGGRLMATVGSRPWTGTEENWLGAGAPMYWSHADTETYLQWLQEAGFEMQWHRFIPEGSGGHTLLLAEAAAR
jgi:SAM-dependent methyltransferase